MITPRLASKQHSCTGINSRKDLIIDQNLVGVLNKLEGLKVEVQKQVERINQARRRIPPLTASVDDWTAFTSQFPTAPTNAVSIEKELHRELANLCIGSVDYHESHPSAGDYWSSLLALNTLDNCSSNSQVWRCDVKYLYLTPALRRPGRFDRIVMVEPPDRQGREEILQVHVLKKQLPLATDVNLSVVAAAMTGFIGANLANLVNEAALLAGQASKRVVNKEDFSQAVERSVAGIEKKRSTLHGSEKGVVARHEASHADVGTAIANLLPSQTRVEKLSILPRTGGTLGFAYIPPGSEDCYLLFVDELWGRLVTLLGGRAAEEVVYSGRVSTGALDDIKRATDVAYKAISEYGLSSSIGPISLATLSSGGLDDSGSAFPWGKDQGHMVNLVQREGKALLQSDLRIALLAI